MKSTKGFREKGFAGEPDDSVRKGVKLPPMRKSGKEKHIIFSNIEEEDEEEFLDDYKKKESVLDYFDDGEEDEI